MNIHHSNFPHIKALNEECIYLYQSSLMLILFAERFAIEYRL